MAPPSFLTLPPEIRYQIYEELLVTTYILDTRFMAYTTFASLSPQLLAVCRQIHAEAMPILYGRNTFEAHMDLLTDLPYINGFRGLIHDRDTRDLMRRFHVDLDLWPPHCLTILEWLYMGALELTIEVYGEPELHPADYSALRRFEIVRGVKKARVYGEVSRFPEYANWLQNSMMAPLNSEVEPFALYIFRVYAENLMEIDG